MRGVSRAGVLITAMLMLAACGDNDNNDTDRGGATPTPLATATPPPIPCPEKLTYLINGPASDLDPGSSGLYFDQQLPGGGALSLAVDCPGDFLGACGVCPLTGPIASTTTIDNHRCADASEQVCTSDTDCPGSACVFFFGPPVAISAAGVPVCITNRFRGSVTGTVSPEVGQGRSLLPLTTGIFTGATVDRPCAVCSGAELNDSGTCSGGARAGMACTVHGTSATLGNTSFDCPPNPSSNIGNLEVPLDLTTGTSALEPTATCVGAPFTGKACYCVNQRLANECDDGLCTVADNGEGTCQGGPTDTLCAVETFRNCASNGDCPAVNDSCTVMRRRKCSGPTDASLATTGPLTRIGTAGAQPVLVSTFCLGATASPAVNLAAGLPGPAAIRLPVGVCIKNACP